MLVSILDSDAGGWHRDQKDVRVLDVASVWSDLYPALHQEHHPKGRLANLFLFSMFLPHARVSWHGDIDVVVQ